MSSSPSLSPPTAGDIVDVTDHTTARVRLHERALGGRENRRHHRHETRPVDRRGVSETWHDEGSVSIRRLRVEGLQVLERARPRPVSELSTLSTNHGGVAIAASRGVRQTTINTELTRPVV